MGRISRGVGIGLSEEVADEGIEKRMEEGFNGVGLEEWVPVVAHHEFVIHPTQVTQLLFFNCGFNNNNVVFQFSMIFQLRYLMTRTSVFYLHILYWLMYGFL